MVGAASMRARRKLLLFVGLLLSEGLQATAREREPDSASLLIDEADEDEGRVVSVPVDDDLTLAAMDPRVGAVPEEEIVAATPDLSEVRWTVDADQPLESLSLKWGLRVSQLLELNPELQGREHVAMHESLRVFAADPAAPTQSIGAPNRGRLAHGIPLPEGDAWQLRDMRRRAFGSRTTVESLVQAFTVFEQEYPGTPPIRVGELSAARGGRAHPHKSHRTGRDVDIGYVLRNPPAEGWRRASARDFDTERNWALIRALVETGKVQQIFVSAGLIKLLEAHAAKELTREELAVYFWDDAEGPHQRPVLKHQNGHRDHMHVRFDCEPENRRCRSRSVERKKKKKKGSARA